MTSDILIVLPHLGRGGTQKVVAAVASRWAEQGLNVSVATLWSREEAHRLAEPVTRYSLDFDDAPRQPKRSLAAKLGVSLAKRVARAQIAIRNGLSGGRTPRVAFAETLLSIKLTYVRTLPDLARALPLIRPSRLVHFAQDRPSAGEIIPYVESMRIAELRALMLQLRPRLAVSFLSKANVMTILAAEDLDTAVVVSERNDIRRQLLEEPWQSLRQFSYPRADLVTANSQGTIDRLSGLIDPARLCVLPNPIDLPDLPDDASRKHRFVVASRFEPHKAIDVVIDAFASFSKGHPGWELHLLGDGPVRAALEAQVRTLGLGDRIRFHGFVEDVVPHLNKARAFVQASRYEGVPNSVLEAMACSLCVVSSNASPGPLEYVVHGRTGLVFDVDDVAKLASAMATIADDPAAARAMGEAARGRLEELSSNQGQKAWDRVMAAGGFAAAEGHAS